MTGLHDNGNGPELERVRPIQLGRTRPFFSLIWVYQDTLQRASVMALAVEASALSRETALVTIRVHPASTPLYLLQQSRLKADVSLLHCLGFERFCFTYSMQRVFSVAWVSRTL